jgi:hypothetical protein
MTTESPREIAQKVARLVERVAGYRAGGYHQLAAMTEEDIQPEDVAAMAHALVEIEGACRNWLRMPNRPGRHTLYASILAILDGTSTAQEQQA